jgi:hypothetical protein
MAKFNYANNTISFLKKIATGRLRVGDNSIEVVI